MKLLFALAVMSAASVQAQPAIAIPRQMAPLAMLQGEWYTSGGWVEFRFSHANTRMTCRVHPDNRFGDWRETMIITLDRGLVLADFLDTKGPVIHYRLVESGGKQLRFEEIGSPSRPRRSITYVRGPAQDQVSWRFQTGDTVTDSGLLVRRARLLPLTE